MSNAGTLRFFEIIKEKRVFMQCTNFLYLHNKFNICIMHIDCAIVKYIKLIY
jgi:hypothetical protein